MTRRALAQCRANHPATRPLPSGGEAQRPSTTAWLAVLTVAAVIAAPTWQDRCLAIAVGVAAIRVSR